MFKNQPPTCNEDLSENPFITSDPGNGTDTIDCGEVKWEEIDWTSKAVEQIVWDEVNLDELDWCTDADVIDWGEIN